MMDFVVLCAIVLPVILIVMVVIQFKNAKPRPRSVVQVRTGTIGAGKTYLSVADCVALVRKLNRWYKRRNNPVWRFFRRTVDKSPVVYSNIPLYLYGSQRRKNGLPRDEWSYVLTREHLLLQDPLPSDRTVIVLIDEIGMICNQYSYNDPNIVSENLIDNYQCVETFIRFYRHFYGEGNRDMVRLYCTDQATGGVCIALRRRFGYIDYLSDFRRYLGILPFYKVDVREMLLAEDQMQNVVQEPSEDRKQNYYFGFLPYRLPFSRCHYDSHCYSGIQYTGVTARLPFSCWRDNNYTYTDDQGRIICSQLKTNYVPDLTMTMSEKAAYKQLLKSKGL